MSKDSSIKIRLKDYLSIKGIEANDNGFIRCLWHDDHHASCKVNDDYLYCFVCNTSGDIFSAAAAMLQVPCDKEHFREIASDVEKTLGIPEWRPQVRGKNYAKLSESAVYRSELLKDFAKALDEEDLNRAYHRAYLLFALFMLPDEKPEYKPKRTIEEQMLGWRHHE